MADQLMAPGALFFQQTHTALQDIHLNSTKRFLKAYFYLYCFCLLAQKLKSMVFLVEASYWHMG